MTSHSLDGLITAISTRLADPEHVAGPQPGWAQQLAYGAPGIALLHIELAAREMAPWQRAHDWLAAAGSAALTCGPDSHPYYGAPTMAHALACAADRLPGAYRNALANLDRHLAADVRRRLAAGGDRLDGGRLPALAEFDAIRGLTGYGAYLLHRNPDGDLLRAVLKYLVRLTEPITTEAGTVPGWWTKSGPSGRADDRFPDGHSNHGVAHGIGGPLALLALAARRGITVPGHLGAIRTICAWLDRWSIDTGRGTTWPYWVTDLRGGIPPQTGPLRPSWCYGAAGLCRAQQLASMALGDTDRQVLAENALISALTDPAQLAATNDSGLCHGYAGLAHVAARAADDALPTTAGQLRALIPALLHVIHPPGTDAEKAAVALALAPEGPGLLDGAAGIALAVLAPSSTVPPSTAWDSCLLIA
ncbi:lanthionine synthetase C family protein [Streptomyces sp. NPDC127084]|uniref:lanthionine synthetase C family protein n=1 Tax=Streptomyces sp. NPDC127084 TaxID=3347133 RepID=UPI00365B2377